jgi:Raf kinase inhibitor-like YbhB/YbcL family protein
MMTLQSSSFRESHEMPQRHGKKVENVSPQLSWTDAPSGTRSFALLLVDMHPIARNYLHWLVTDVPADVASLADGAADGAMPLGSHQLTPYTGPFPPSGTHDYRFTLYALDVERLGLPRQATVDRFVKAVAPHTLATATLMGTFTSPPAVERKRP